MGPEPVPATAPCPAPHPLDSWPRRAATADRLSVGSAGDATQAIRVVVPVTGDPSVTAVTVDHIVVRSGRALAGLTFEHRTQATPVETIDEFSALAADRLSA
jgi:hypothetical protein